MRDALKRIIYNHCELIGKQTIGTLDDEITDFVFKMLGSVTLQSIIEKEYPLPLDGGGLGRGRDLAGFIRGCI